jgi:hypothetical protein
LRGRGEGWERGVTGPEEPPVPRDSRDRSVFFSGRTDAGNFGGRDDPGPEGRLVRAAVSLAEMQAAVSLGDAADSQAMLTTSSDSPLMPSSTISASGRCRTPHRQPLPRCAQTCRKSQHSFGGRVLSYHWRVAVARQGRREIPPGAAQSVCRGSAAHHRSPDQPVHPPVAGKLRPKVVTVEVTRKGRRNLHKFDARLQAQLERYLVWSFTTKRVTGSRYRAC